MVLISLAEYNKSAVVVLYISTCPHSPNQSVATGNYKNQLKMKFVAVVCLLIALFGLSFGLKHGKQKFD